NLKNKGFITFENNISRSIHILDYSNDIPNSVGSGSRIVALPLMGKVAAGLPIQHFLENETIEIPESMLRKPGETYALQVQGDSMIEDCICDGDLVVVEHRNYADNGDMVIAMINHSEATLKRFFHEGDKIRLQPSNHLMEPIYVDPQKLSIHGIVIGVMRSYR
ncbi:transcriptional repressor LexA, partial [bacterium]|nr:transcriptional repressor LexA [bacterium]